MIVFSRLCTLIVAFKLAFEVVFIVLTALGAREDYATGGGVTLGVVAGFAAMMLLVRAQERLDNETLADGVKRGLDAARAEAREAEEHALTDGS
jgi:hypothetical protein